MIRTGLITLLVVALAACTPASPSPSQSVSPSMAASTTPEPTAEPTAEPTQEPTPEPTATPLDPMVFAPTAADLPESYGFTVGFDSEITLDSEEANYGTDSGRRADLMSRGFLGGWGRSFHSAGGAASVSVSVDLYIFDNAAGALAEEALETATSDGCTSADIGETIGDASDALTCSTQVGDFAEVAFTQGNVTFTLFWLRTFPGDNGPRLDLLVDLAKNLQMKVSG